MQNASRRGAVDMGMPLMILAFIVIGGFMYWLSGQAANQVAVAEHQVLLAKSLLAPTTALSVVVGIATLFASKLSVETVAVDPQVLDEHLRRGPGKPMLPKHPHSRGRPPKLSDVKRIIF